MASIRKRGDHYQIRVFVGEDQHGKKIMKTKTWKPNPSWGEKKIQKELKKVEVDFEAAVKKGNVADGNIRFDEFAEKWMEEHKTDLRIKSVIRYESLLKRIIPALGHLKLREIHRDHLSAFYKNLQEEGIKNVSVHHPKIDIDEKRKEMKLSKMELSRRSGASYYIVTNVCKGNNLQDRKAAAAIAEAIGTTYRKAFEEIKTQETLSTSTIAQHHRLLHTMFDTAILWGYMTDNPCNRVKPPRVIVKRGVTLNIEEVERLFECFADEPIDRRTAVIVLMNCGLRKGELCGLKWSDVNFETGVLSVSRSLKYVTGKGLFEEPPKTENSIRSIKMPSDAVIALKEHKRHQAENRLKLGDRWHDTGYIFTGWDGNPMHPDSLYQWFKTFIKKNNLPEVTLHSLRHTNASMMIANGVNLATVSKRLGHADTSITTRIYTHEIKEADAVAAEVLENIFSVKKKAVAK